MARPTNDVKFADKLPKNLSDLHPLDSTDHLLKEWCKLCWEEDGHLSSDTADAVKNSQLFDDRLGLGLLPRVLLIRAVIRTMLCWGKAKAPDSSAWQLCLRKPVHYSEIIKSRALRRGPGCGLTEDVLAVLRDPHWQQRLCNGNGRDDDQQVLGLNRWFESQYVHVLEGGRITPEHLFNSSFFGADAPERFVYLLCTGKFSPGVNRSLLPATLRKIAARHEEEARRIADFITCGDNGGRPIVPVLCPNHPSAATSLAAQLLDELEERGYSACYIPLRMHLAGGRLDDAGFRSIVHVLYRFVKGDRDLATAAEASRTVSIAEQIEAVRVHWMQIGTALVFDGFDTAPGYFPEIVEFIRDSPLGPLLRHLQHPLLKRGKLPGTLSKFRTNAFVVFGEAAPPWLTMAQSKKPFTILSPYAGIDAMLRAPLSRPILNLNTIRSLLSLQTSVPAEWQLYLLDFLISMGDIQVTRDFDEASSLDGMLVAGFERFWQKLEKWQQLYLGAQALSETGIRFSTALQLFESYARIMRIEDRGLRGGFKPAVKRFEEFIVRTSEPQAPALFVRYPDSIDSRLSDVLDAPSQSITSIPPDDPWLIAHQERDSRTNSCVEFLCSQFRQMAVRLIPDMERQLIRRILSELAIQAYRIRARSLHVHGGTDRRAARHLVEALLHGMLSIGNRADWSAGKRDFIMREIPPSSAGAFQFLYFTVYRDLLCGGDLTGFARRIPNGDLEIELLMLMANPAEESLVVNRTVKRALKDPENFVRAPSWLGRCDAATAQRARILHLQALCHCAKRATRLSVFNVAMNELEEALDKAQDRNPTDSLTCAKLKCDLAMHSLGMAGTEYVAGRTLLLDGLEAIVHASGTSSRDKVRATAAKIRKVLRKLRYNVHDYVGHLVNESRGDEYQAQSELALADGGNACPEKVLRPEMLVQYKDEAFAAIARLVPLSSLPPDAISMLGRIAILNAHIGDVWDAKGGRERAKALSHYLSAVSIFWLAKAMAGARMRERPLSAPSRVSAQNAEELVRVCAAIRRICHELKRVDGGWLHDKLERTLRATLDTYARERSSVRADRSVMLVLESSFARTQRGATFDHLGRFIATESITGDRRLDVIQRCLNFLSDAEAPMLSVAARPGLRITLCKERIDCLSTALDLICQQSSWIHSRSFNEVAARAYPMLEWVANDLRQIDAFIDFLEEYAPVAQRHSIVWTETLREKLKWVSARLQDWKKPTLVDEWLAAHDRLAATVAELAERYSQAASVPARLTDYCARELPAARERQSRLDLH